MDVTLGVSMRRRDRIPWAQVPLFLVLLFALPIGAAPKSFWAFETGPVRPIAMSPDGSRLFVTNIPDGHLEIFSLSSVDGPVHEASVPVGLEPCAVAARSDDEVWVVNHLSDSISIVDLTADPPRVVRTLLVGDEPRDIVFAGAGGSRAFVTTAHRGQNHPNDPQLSTPGVGRADVWVFDANSLGDPVSGTPLAILQLFADTPRALAATADGSKVFAAAFLSGNQTMTLRESFFDPVLPPLQNTLAPIAPTPQQGRILGFDGTDWRDATGAAVAAGTVRFRLPDKDVFEIDADAPVPSVIAEHAHVGTVLFGMTVHPTSGKVYVANTDANNRDRFEGFSTTHGSLRGELHRAQVTVIDGSSVSPRHLNKHLTALPEYSAEGDVASRDKSLATPVAVEISGDGSKLYVAAFGSSRIGVFDVSEIEGDTFVPDESSHIVLSGGGPGGLVLDEPRGLLYVYTRFDNGVAVVDLERGVELFSRHLSDREPSNIKGGRPILYDARFSSSNGEASCAACHVFGDLDGLAWNLGDPDLAVVENSNPLVSSQSGSTVIREFHPLKGPMTTQTFRGMDGHGPLHWRGDRTAVSGGGVFDDEFSNFLTFDVAFVGLLGRQAVIPSAEMAAFADFILEVVPPPNPIAPLDGSLTTLQQLGLDIFTGPVTDGSGTCTACHTLDVAAGHFGTSGETANIGPVQDLKVPHLRNVYQKVGRFGMDGRFSQLGSQLTGDPNDDQIRGFGFIHDGSFDTIRSFLEIFNFVPAVTQFGLTGVEEAAGAVEQFLFAFPAVLAPIVGQQVTIQGSGSTPPITFGLRIQSLEQRALEIRPISNDANARACDLVVKGAVAGASVGYRFDPISLLYVPDSASGVSVTTSGMFILAGQMGSALTWTCAPPGSGQRVGLDRDEDDVLDGDDNCQMAPNGPGGGTCIVGDPTSLGASCTTASECGVGGVCSIAQEDTGMDGLGDACDPVFVPEPAFGVGTGAAAALLGFLRCVRRRGERRH